MLVVDDDPEAAPLVDAALSDRRLAVTKVPSPTSVLAALEAQGHDVVVTSLDPASDAGVALCAELARRDPSLPVIVITPQGTIEPAVAAIRAGAYDFVTRPLDVEALRLAVERALQHRNLREEVKRLRDAVERPRYFEEIVGASAPIRALCDLLERVARSDASVLITGESGTGKEVVARALHRRSRRATGPFVPLSCAAVPEALLESELFGHAKGAFTDAKVSRPGLFSRATGGTLFLDEIGDMPLGLQPKLLRALQERVVRPVGSDVELPYDARIIAATNRDLESAIEERRFRQDLYFRVNVIHIELPPLRSRGGDVLILGQRFLERVALETGKAVTSFSNAAAQKLLSYSWPGNVRELQNCVERAVALTRHEQIQVDDLPERICDHKSSHVLVVGDDPSELAPLEEMERRYILRVLEATRGNKSVAARVLGLDRKTLYRKLDRYGASSDTMSPRSETFAKVSRRA